ncbi:prepilin-type N-terminal cleavage/methylation domain-containing protein [Aeromonas media]|uniref:prepilin-type N-terminal cleavage/methylation domain-containing protein n=1 Tax=Aeromonas media TaxID=651 RepID=UPI0038D18A02
MFSLSIGNAKGFSLVELMVAMVAGLLLVAAVISLFATVLRADQTAMQVSRLNQEIQSITDLIARDIQRAGYDASAATETRLKPGGIHPFYFNTNTHVNNSCIIVRYDGRDEGTPSSDNGLPDLKEAVVYSYRADKSVWLAELSPSVSSPVSTLTECSSGGNRISTDDTIVITDLTFTMLSGSVSTGARAIQLNISGKYKSNSALTLNLQRDIKLRNDGH